MAATVIINRLTGAGPTATDITSINTRANAEDAHSVAGVGNPIQIPPSGTNYSYWVVTQLEASTTPAGLIDNIRWFMSGSPSAGTSIKGESATAYTQATGTVGETGTQLTVGNYPSLAGAPADLTPFTSGSPKSISGSIANPSTGAFGDRLVYQLEVTSAALPGVSASLTLSWQYDET